MNPGTKMTGIDRHFLEENLANRRKPRMYTTLATGAFEDCPYPLDFCVWLHRNFDGLLTAIHAGTISQF